jgi:hypothetical protein
MRKDMNKVINERPRIAQFQSWDSARTLKKKSNVYRKANFFRLDDDGDVCDVFCGTNLPMRSRLLGWKLKTFNENLNPLKRFLLSRAGQHWDAVYSEIMEHLATKSTINYHVWMHVKSDVVQHTFQTADGRVWEWGNKQMPCDHEGEFYVEPETGILRAGTVKYRN